MAAEEWMGEHTMVALNNGLTTCNCGSIHASPNREDVFIHIVWALTKQRDAMKAAMDAAYVTVKYTVDSTVKRLWREAGYDMPKTGV